MNSKWTDKQIEKLSKKYNLGKATIRMIVMSQFELTREVVRSADESIGYFPSIRLPLLGVFKVKRTKIKYLNKKKKDKKVRRKAILLK